MSAVREMFGRGAERVGVSCVFLFGLLALVSREHLSLLLITVAFLCSRPPWLRLLREPVFILCVACAVYVAVRGVSAAYELPALSHEHFQQTFQMLRSFLFVPIAWFLARNPSRIGVFLMLTMIGLLLKLLGQEDWLWLGGLLSGAMRADFGFRPIALALYASAALLGLLVFSPNLIGLSSHRFRAVRSLAWVLAVAVFIVVLIATQSRAIWLATILVVPPILFIRYRSVLARGAALSVRRRLFIAGVTLLIGVGTTLGLMYVAQRTVDERGVIEPLLAGERNELPRTSISYRFDINRFGIEKWLERPWFGWGPGASRYLFASSGRSELWRPTAGGELEPFGHFHNTYLELLIRFGAVGTLLFLIPASLLLPPLWRSHRTERVSREYPLFIGGVFGLIAIWSAFSANPTKLDWQNFWMVMLSIGYAYRLHLRTLTD